MDTYFFTFIMEFSDLIKGVLKKEIKDVEILLFLTVSLFVVLDITYIYKILNRKS